PSIPPHYLKVNLLRSPSHPKFFGRCRLVTGRWLASPDAAAPMRAARPPLQGLCQICAVGLPPTEPGPAYKPLSGSCNSGARTRDEALIGAISVKSGQLA